MFCDFFRERCGLHFTEDSRFLLEKRLHDRVEALDLGSPTAYHYLLRRDRSGDGELATIIDDLTTNETYFFRERGQLSALMGEILPDLIERRRAENAPPIALWSAGCSSGEEPYTLVMMALEAGLEPGRDFRVYASDISRRMLARAREGLYRPASFRETDPVDQKRHFTEERGRWRISDEIKRHVVFTRVNLLDRPRIALLGTMDVVVCRNVMIYFDCDTKKQVIDTFWDKLRPGGHLLLGHAESLIHLSTAFELRHLERDLVYRRPVRGEERRDPWQSAAWAAIRAELPAREGSKG